MKEEIVFVLFFVGCKCHLEGDTQRSYDPGMPTTPQLYPRKNCATWCRVPLSPVPINSASRNLEVKMSKRGRAALRTLLLCPSYSFPGMERSGALVTGWVLVFNPCLMSEDRYVRFGEIFAKLNHGKLHTLITSYLFLFTLWLITFLRICKQKKSLTSSCIEMKSHPPCTREIWSLKLSL